MWLISLLFGFAPWRPGAPVPADASLPTGAPAPHLEWSAELSARLTQTDRWQDFTDRWGGPWAARWDPRTHTPRFLYAPGVPAADMARLVRDVARLAGVRPSELVEGQPTVRGDRIWHRFARVWHGVPVEGDEVLVSVQQGRIGGVWVRLTPIAGLPQPRAGEVVRPLPTGNEQGKVASGRVVAHLVTRSEAEDVVTYTDRDGTVVHRYSNRHYSALEVSHLERTVGDDHVESPARQLMISDAGGTADITADDGSHGLSGELSVFLDGPALEVLRNGAAQGPLTVAPDSSGVGVLEGGTDISDASASVLHHFHTVFDWLALRWASHPWLGQKVTANVDMSTSACNAYYTSGTINFFVGYGSYCHNYGQIADVIYHEVGHGIHHYILAGGTFAGDVSEGSADFVSATINGDPIVGLNASPSGGIVRELESDRVYPDDVQNEVHADGLIWGSFLWNLRTEWQSLYGDDAGAEATDRLFLGTLEQGPSLTDLYEAVILADDDDGDLSNGTPHACELVDLLDQHGLGPGPLGVVVMDHRPLGPQGSSTSGYAVDFGVFSPTIECADFDPGSVELWYSTGALGRTPGVLGDDGTAWTGWTQVPLTVDEETGTQFSGTIPRQLATTQVHYFMRAASTEGAEVIWSHGGTEAGVHSFRVGDRDTIWCEDFESGVPADWLHGGGRSDASLPDQLDEWEVAEPITGAPFVPDRATSGSRVMGTHVSGLYAPNNQQFLMTAPIAVPEGRMTLLTYQRWLTVEDGIYDQAVASIDGEVYFENPSSTGGLDHTLDVDWKAVELEVDPLRDGLAADGELVLEWTLTSDPGLEFGGWSLDDVCVEQLADEEGHYLRLGLRAEVEADQTVSLRWENPWIAPLDQVVLVATEGTELGDIEDAATLLQLSSATPGAAGFFLDGRPLEPGMARTYALLASASPGDELFDAVQLGENLVTVSRDPLPEDTGVGPDTGDTGPAYPTDGEPTEDSASPAAEDGGAGASPEQDKDCGCTASGRSVPVGMLWWMPLAVIGGVRRRR